MRIAVFSDVHGNDLALRAVLDAIAADAPDAVVNLGDTVSGPFDPAAAAARQMASGAVTVAGNHDRWAAAADATGSDAIAHAALDPSQRAWLAALPATAVLDEVFACHGSPAGGDLENLLEDVAPGAPILELEQVIAPRLAGIGAARVVLCGHTHIPRAVQVGPVLVVNPGSVGMPAFAFHLPVPHRMEGGSPHARYALLTRRDALWSFDLKGVAYDWEGAARQADAHGRPDTAQATRSGRA